MPGTDLPARARVVIVGGGVIGTSTAYHLTKLGIRDVVLLEQAQLSSGTTWHAAGLVGQLRGHSVMTKLIQYSTKLYAGLHAETGLQTGWKNCGSLSVARSDDRMALLRRTIASARAQGVEVEALTPKEAQAKWPPMQVDDLKGAIWLPGDGKANPTDLTQSLAKGARMGGAQIFEAVRVTGITQAAGRVTGVVTAQGVMEAEIVVNCAGQWARKLGLMCGVSVPMHSAEHMYIVTGPLPGVHPDLPVMRDPDGYIYFKEEVGGLCMGGFEPEAKPWGMAGIPDDFAFQLLEDDWDQFEILMENALIRVPGLQDAQVKTFYNGPESFTPDNNFLLGEAPELRGFFVGAGFNSMGIASAGGAGMALAEWIAQGAPTMDLWPVDIRRFAGFQNNPSFLHDRVKETLGMHYSMPWPNFEQASARPLRRTALYDRLSGQGAVWGSKMGWERPLYFARAKAEAQIAYSFDRQNWHDTVLAEQRATRMGASLFDLSSFAKLMVEGPDALAVLNRICAANIDQPVGRSIYTGMLNLRGGYESDLTVMRLGAARFLLVTGSAQAVHDADWIAKNTPEGARVWVSDVTNAWSVLAVMGPQAPALLQRLSQSDLSDAAFPFASHRAIDLGYATVIANRLSYAGTPGFELFVPVEFTLGVYEDIQRLGITNAGYYALEALRIEKAFRAWGRELTPDITPLEAGLGFAVDFDKAGGFVGQAALLAQRGQALRQRIVQISLAAPEATLWGGELLLRDGEPVGKVMSAAFGATLGRPVALCRMEGGALDGAALCAARFEVDVAGLRLPALWHAKPPL
ncbi:FAD-dependent oxidoreductase [Pseudorhodobacter sp. E13]|uniref:GcvT family protein n=1 Tax=Pseudorhodobacter sp. E13 TaxID=2487931 RepID=UPI000F8C31F4|nr:FAD-dependent oxidoreductase [Pseudorhodobacter sp. E13]RUS59316.1 FAD-dependent oxidoreductase [Pseudorhodobacter sp. E13]